MSRPDARGGRGRPDKRNGRGSDRRENRGGENRSGDRSGPAPKRDLGQQVEGRQAVRALLHLGATGATVLVDGREQVVPIDQL